MAKFDENALNSLYTFSIKYLSQGMKMHALMDGCTDKITVERTYIL